MLNKSNLDLSAAGAGRPVRLVSAAGSPAHCVGAGTTGETYNTQAAHSRAELSNFCLDSDQSPADQLLPINANLCGALASLFILSLQDPRVLLMSEMFPINILFTSLLLFLREPRV